MKIYYEPVNITQWNMFEKVKEIGHVEPFLAVKSMRLGDKVLLYVGQQDKRYVSGIYAYGKIIKEPYILRNSPNDYCNNKLTVDVKIEKISYNYPLVDKDECSHYIKSYRRVHEIKGGFEKLVLE